MNVTIRIIGLENVQRKLSVSLGPALHTSAMAIGELIRNVIAVYPGPVSHPIRWASEKQRRWYFAMRREKGLSPGYTRQFDAMSQRLGPSWTVAPHGAWGAVVGTRVSYAPYVQEAARQQPMHAATGWVTDVSAVAQVSRSGQIKTVIERAIRGALGI